MIGADGRVSTPEEKLQRQREEREKREAAELAVKALWRARQGGYETATAYGQALVREMGERLRLGVDAALSDFAAAPTAARPHGAAFPVLLHFAKKGPALIAAVTMRVVIDRISTPRRRMTLERELGEALELELVAMKAGASAATRHAFRRIPRRQRLHVPSLLRIGVRHERWTIEDRQAVGALLLDLVIRDTGLLQERRGSRGGGRGFVEASRALEELLCQARVGQVTARQLPMLVRPRPWEGLQGGGGLLNDRPLVTDRKGIALPAVRRLAVEDLAPVLEVVNHQQSQGVWLDPWMVEQQRSAWDANLPGLFKVGRDPVKGEPLADKSRRLQVQTSLDFARSVQGRPAWFAHEVDYRGRIYTTNRFCTHQGPDWEKGTVGFGPGEVCGETGIDMLLMGAANHYGVGRDSWEERLRWGRERRPLLIAAAENPLDRLELWRDAKDPWQFLQAARAYQQWQIDRSAPVRCPVRLDQTVSGCGIMAALLRDRDLALLTNVIGSQRADLYEHVADALRLTVQMELEASEEESSRQMAALWLEQGIDRKLLKRPVMARSYGSRLLGIEEAICAELEGRIGGRRLSGGQYRWQVVRPALWLSRHMYPLLNRELAAVSKLDRWLRSMVVLCHRRGKGLRWTTPMGWAVELGGQADFNTATRTEGHGTLRWPRFDDEGRPPQLGARTTCQSACANLIHSFDAAFCWEVVCSAAAQGAPLLTTHDCFATTPNRAAWLHATLLRTMRETHKTPWLEEIAQQMAGHGGLPVWPQPPVDGGLSPAEVGQNDYLFS